MGTGWRRAFCTTSQRDPEKNGDPESERNDSSQTPRSYPKFGFLSGRSFSNPATPRFQGSMESHLLPSFSDNLRCKTKTMEPSLGDVKVSDCYTPRRASRSPGVGLLGSRFSSPRTPLKQMLKNSFAIRSRCGVCMCSLKTRQGMAVFTAECNHGFHFPCIVSHVEKTGRLSCPICHSSWKDVPLLSTHIADHHSEHHKKLETASTPSSDHVSPSPSISLAKCTSHKPSYDDDEPLASPCCKTSFFPIPEDDEVEDDDYQAFMNASANEADDYRRFLVETGSSKSGDVLRGCKNPRGIQVRVIPDIAVISSSLGYETYAVSLKIKAPSLLSREQNHKAVVQQRAPMDLVTVLDLGCGPTLHLLKRTMRLVVSSLGPADRLSLVAFSSSSKRLLPLIRMTPGGQKVARSIVHRLISNGTDSNAAEALRKANRVLEERRERNPVATVMLLSESCGHQGQSKNNTTRKANPTNACSTRFSHVEIPVTAFGLGHRSVDGDGSLARCVGGLLSVVVRDLRIQLGFSQSSAEVISVYSSSDSSPAYLGTGSVRLGDLYAEEERELLVEIRVPAKLDFHPVMSLRFLYKDPATQEVVYDSDQRTVLRLHRPPTTTMVDSKFQRLRCLFVTARAIAEARRLAEQFEYSSAGKLLESSKDLLHKWGGFSEYVETIESELVVLHRWRQHHERHRPAPTGIQQREGVDSSDALTPTSAWRAADRLAKLAALKSSSRRVSDLHGFEYARF